MPLLESMRNMNNLLQIRYFGLIPRFYSLNNALFASQNHEISLKISDFRDDSHTPHRLLGLNHCQVRKNTHCRFLNNLS